MYIKMWKERDGRVGSIDSIRLPEYQGYGLYAHVFFSYLFCGEERERDEGFVEGREIYYQSIFIM